MGISNMPSPGYLIITDPDVGVTENDTFMCCHCNRIIIVRRGSGIERGFCRMCMQPHCGKKSCWNCVPFERKLEEMEARYRFQKAMDRF